MLTHAQHVAQTQSKRQRALDAVRKRFATQEALEAADRAVRIKRRNELEAIRIQREQEQKERMRIKLMESCGDIALSLDEVLALHPCRRIAAVRRMLKSYWDTDTPVTAQQALDAGCQLSDISWVQQQLKKYY